MTLGLEAAGAADEGSPAGPSEVRTVEVAIDAAGRGGDRTYTYLVPEALADLGVGEPVLVEFGRRQALGVVLGESAVADDVATKPIIDRVRADGPLLPPLTVRLARWIAEHYLAPPAFVLRAMLPPGLLERLELVAELVPSGRAGAAAGAVGEAEAGSLDAADLDLLGQLDRGPRPVRDLAAPDGRAGLLRRVRGLESERHGEREYTSTRRCG